MDYFEIGESYFQDSINYDIFILGIVEQSKDGVWLAISHVNRKTHTQAEADELFVPTKDIKKWKKRD